MSRPDLNELAAQANMDTEELAPILNAAIRVVLSEAITTEQLAEELEQRADASHVAHAFGLSESLRAAREHQRLAEAAAATFLKRTVLK